MRSSVDNRSPQQYLNNHTSKPKSRGNSRHNINHLKKKEIEMENNALINKMLKIMQRGVKSTVTSPKQRKKSQTGMQSYLPTYYAQESSQQLGLENSSALTNMNQSLSNSNQQLNQSLQNQSSQQSATMISQSKFKIFQQPLSSPLNSQQSQPQIDPHLYNQFIQFQNKVLGKSPSNSVMKIHPSQIHGYNTHANVSPQAFYRGSLNYGKRKHEIDIINQTNQQLLKALRNAKPSVNRDDLKSHEKRIQKLKQHIGQVRYGSPLNLIIQKPEAVVRSYVQSPNRLSKTPKRQVSRGHLTTSQQYLNEVNFEVRPQTQQSKRNHRLNQSADYSIHSSQMRQMINTQKYFLPQQETPQSDLNYQLSPQSLIFNNNPNYKIEVNDIAEKLNQKGELQDDLQGSSRVSSSGNLQIGATGGADEYMSKKKRRKSSRQQLQFNQTAPRAVTPLAMTNYQDVNQLQMSSTAYGTHNISTNLQPQRKVKSRARGTSQGLRYNQKDLQIISNYQANINNVLGQQFMHTPTTRNATSSKNNANSSQISKKHEIVNSVLMPKQEKFAKLPGTVKNIISAQRSIAKNIQSQQKNRQMKLSDQIQLRDSVKNNQDNSIQEGLRNKMLESSISKIQPSSFGNYDKSNAKSSYSNAQNEQFNHSQNEEQFLNQMLTPQNYKSPQFNTQNTPSEEIHSSLKQQVDDSINQSEEIKPSQFMAIPQIQINSNPMNLEEETYQNSSKLMRTNTKHLMAMNKFEDQHSDPWNKSTFDTQKMSNQLSFNTSQQEPLKSKLPPKQDDVSQAALSTGQQTQSNLSSLALALKKAKQEKDTQKANERVNSQTSSNLSQLAIALKQAKQEKEQQINKQQQNNETEQSSSNLSQLAMALKKAKQEKQQMQTQVQQNQAKLPGSLFGALKGAQAFKVGIQKQEIVPSDTNQSSNNLSQLAQALKIAKQEKQIQDQKQKDKEEKILNNSAAQILLNSHQKRVKAEKKALQFIQILKQKIIQRKALLVQIQADDEGTKAAKNFFGQIMGMAQKAPPKNEDSLSIKYSDDSFEMGNQDDFMSPEGEDKEAFEKYLKGNKMIEQKIEQEERDEQDIIDQAQKILSKIQDSVLQQKINSKVTKFIEILKEKVIETKQKQVVRRMFGKKLNMFAKKEKANDENQGKVLQTDSSMLAAGKFISHLKEKEQRQTEITSNPNQFIKLLKDNHRDAAAIRAEFESLSENAKKILTQFFKVVWSRVNVKKLVKQFISNLKMASNNSNLENCQKNETQLQGIQANPDVASRIIGRQVRSSNNASGDSLDSYESLSRLQKDMQLFQATYPQQKYISDLNEKSRTQNKFQERIEAQKREQFFIKKLRESLKNSNSQKVNISDEERAKQNASSFIKTLQDNSQIKRKALKLVKLFAIILKSKVSERKKIAEHVVGKIIGPSKSKEQTKTSFISLSNRKPKTQRDEFGLKSIHSPELWKSINWEFKRLICGLFQRKFEKRDSKIFILYMALEFKQRVIMLLQRDFKTNFGKRDDEKPIYENLKRFLYINNIKQKYIQMKGQIKYQEYIHRSKYFYKRLANQKAKLRYILATYSQQKDGKIKSQIKYFIAKLFQQRSYSQYILYNPFRFNVLYLKDVKQFIAHLFQNKIDLLGRPRNIFKVKGLTPSTQQVKRFIALQFQLKNIATIQGDNVKQKKVIASGKSKLKGFVNLIKMKPNQNNKKQDLDFNFAQINDVELWNNLKEKTAYVIAKTLQLNEEQRQSRFRVLFLGQQFKASAFEALDQFRFNLIEKKGDIQLIKNLRAFVLLNQIRIKNSKMVGERKSLEYIYRLRFLARRSLNNKKMINFKIKNAKSDEQKFEILRTFVAKLFQQKSFSGYVRYNPFQFNNLSMFQVKRFICDSFQYKRDLIGRPRNIFRHKLRNPTMQEVRLYIAKHFQMKNFNTLKHKFNLLFHRLRINRIVNRFVKYMMTIHFNLKKRQSDIAAQVMHALNFKFQDEDGNSSRIATARVNSGGDSSYEFDSQNSVGIKPTQKKDKNSMKDKQSEKDSHQLKDEMESEYGDELFDGEDDSAAYRKLLQDTKAHIKESKPSLQRKVSMYKNNMKNNLATNFKKKLIEGKIEMNEEVKLSEQENSMNNLKMLAQALKQKKQEKAETQAQQFISGLQQMRQNSEKKQETVQKAVDNFMIKKKDQRAKIIIDEDD